MRTRAPLHPSFPGGRHELGQNFLVHRPTIRTIVDLVAATSGSILEIGAGNGALTVPLAALGRDLVAIDVDPRRVRGLQQRLPALDVRAADALQHPLDRSVIVGNLPYHLTTPILRRLLAHDGWREAVLLTQWEVARKRASVGGGTMMTAQAAPWFTFALHGRVPARHFAPMPSVDGGILGIRRRDAALVAPSERKAYERFVRGMFTGTGRDLAAILTRHTGMPRGAVRGMLRDLGIGERVLPRELRPDDWSRLWGSVARAKRR